MESITLAKFLTHYYGIQHPNILNLTHDDVKALVQETKRCSFEFASDNQELVASGKIVYVTDKYNKAVPYLAPQLDIDFECCDFEIERAQKQKLKKIDEQDLKGLTNWELIQLLRQYKNYCSCNRIIHKEMENRHMKEKRKVKNDKYQRR